MKGYIKAADGKKYKAIMPTRYKQSDDSSGSRKQNNSPEDVFIKRIEGDHFIVCPK